MKQLKEVTLISIGVLICLLVTGLQGYTSDKKLPVIDGKITVATVNDDPITIEEFKRAIAASHAGRSEGKKAGRIDYSAIMNRIINTRLIVIEARNIGLDELPGVENTIQKYSRQTLMELLMEQHVKDIKPTEEEVQKGYEEIVKEWQITTVWFEREEAAKKFEEEIKAGKNFAETAKKALEEGLTEEVNQGKYVKDKDLALPVAQLVAKMELGSVSPIVTFGEEGFMIFKLEGVRFPEDEDAEARERAKEQALDQARLQAARAYYRDLKEKYVKVDEDLFASLDYDAEEPGLDSLLQDKRVVVEVSGENPVTVGELSKALKQKFYHGIEKATASKRVNEKKGGVLEGILQERVLLKEALKQGLDNTEEYNSRVKEYEISVIFGLFIRKVISPDIRLDRKELKTYYKENSEEYMTPEMMRIKSLVFRKKSDAVNALNKLMEGTDFDWLSSREEGQMDKNSKSLLRFEGQLVTSRSLPEGVREAVSAVNPGDYRLYESAEGYFYVLYVYYLLPAKPRPFEEVKKEIAREVFDDKVKKAVEDYADKLREYYPVKIYAKDLR